MIKRQTGFTLLEAIITMVIMSILATIITTFIKIPIDGYFSAVQRAEMAYAADSVMQRITRDMRGALPNSFRQSADLKTQCIEFIPAVAGGRYRQEFSSTGSTDGHTDVPLYFDKEVGNFDVLASQGLEAVDTSKIFFFVIGNLGIPGASVYENNNRAKITGKTLYTDNPNNKIAHLSISATTFPIALASAGSRFQIIPDYSVTYTCKGGIMRRFTRPIVEGSSLAEHTTCPATGDVLAENITDNAGADGCSFDLTKVAFQNTAQISIRLNVTQNKETVNLYQEIYVSNQP